MKTKGSRKTDMVAVDGTAQIKSKPWRAKIGLLLNFFSFFHLLATNYDRSLPGTGWLCEPSQSCRPVVPCLVFGYI